MTIERALSGESLYKSTADLTALIPEGYKVKPWDELSWQEQDDWEERAHEINEARRGTP